LPIKEAHSWKFKPQYPFQIRNVLRLKTNHDASKRAQCAARISKLRAIGRSTVAAAVSARGNWKKTGMLTGGKRRGEKTITKNRVHTAALNSKCTGVSTVKKRAVSARGEYNLSAKLT
jgi:hypothetical protein